ncbi:MAG TPA: hypothetical protein VGL05_18570 [Kribbella sp.]
MFLSAGWQRRRARRLIRRSARFGDAGRWSEARRANEDAERLVRALIEVTGARQDRRVLGSLLYNRAALLARLGDTERAYYAAEDAVAAYHSVDPTWGSPKLVALALTGDRIPPAESGGLYRILRIADEAERNHKLAEIAEPHGIGWAEIQEIIAQAADARARCHRLAALTADGSARLESANLDTPAETYRQLILRGDRYTTLDLDRVETQIAETRQLLAGN